MGIDSNQIPGKETIKNRVRWKNTGVRVSEDVAAVRKHFFSGTSGPIAPPSNVIIDTPIDAYDFFNRDIITNFFLQATNRRAHIELARGIGVYASIVEGWVDVTLQEMDKFWGLLLYFALMKAPCQRDYWTGGLLGNHIARSLFSRRRFEQIKHCLMVANPSQEENAEDRLAKVRPYLDAVRERSQSSWVPARKQGMDESQQQCGHRNSRCSHRAETSKPLSDYIKIVAAHESKTGYCYAFVVDERLPNVKVQDLMMAVLVQYPDATELETETPQTRTFACDRFYITVDNVVKAWFDKKQLIYGTIRGDRGPQHCGIGNPRLQYGEFVWSQSDAPMPLTMFRWRDSDPKGSWFLSPYHNPDTTEVSRRCHSNPTMMKSCPVCASDYNEEMGACDQCNSLRSSYTTYLTHKRRWYMGLIYYGKDILDINAYIYFIHYTQAKMSQKEFRISVITSNLDRCVGPEYVVQNITRKNQQSSPSPCQSKRKRRIITSPSSITQNYSNRLVHADHLPDYVKEKRERRLCRLCYLVERKQRHVFTFCICCDVFLCYTVASNGGRNCFKIWHERDDLHI